MFLSILLLISEHAGRKKDLLCCILFGVCVYVMCMYVCVCYVQVCMQEHIHGGQRVLSLPRLEAHRFHWIGWPISASTPQGPVSTTPVLG